MTRARKPRPCRFGVDKYRHNGRRVDLVVPTLAQPATDPQGRTIVRLTAPQHDANGAGR